MIIIIIILKRINHKIITGTNTKKKKINLTRSSEMTILPKNKIK